MIDKLTPTVEGFITIIDKETGETLVAKKNKIHYENMSNALAKSLGNKANGPIYAMAFGNGGSSVDSLGIITYLEPNVTGASATLYNETFSKVVDDNAPGNLDVTENNIVIEHENSKFYTDVITTCTLDFGEPAGQEAFDTSTAFNESYVFDELCLKTEDDLLITHVIFHPVQKSLNRVIEVIYTLRISVQ